jgi:paraquat-inducible protein B
MTDEVTNNAPVIKNKSRISGIWILPIIAALVGIGMVYKEWQDRGQSIIIGFESAEGLEIKKTKVKYKSVDIGILDSIEFNEEGNGVLAKVVIERDMTKFLRTDSQFWVVRPRVGSSGISGIGTLFSGAYITMEPGKDQALGTRFEGLESPPVSSPNDEGLKVNLVSTGGKALNQGNPVIYRGFEVGAIEAVDFDVESREITYDVFVNAPFHNLITTNTFFWNAGGYEFSTTGDGFSIDFASIETIIAGGIEFDIPEDLPLGERITETTSFKLYGNKSKVTEERAYEYLEYVLLVEDSIAGIQKGTPVEYRGIRIGRVAKPYLGFHQTNLIDPSEERIAVVIHIEPARLSQENSYTLEWFDKQFKEWIKNGLVATLENANYLTGSMKISLDMTPKTADEITMFGDYIVIPIGESGFAGILEKTDLLLAKLNNLNVEGMIANANSAMQSAEESFDIANETFLASQAMFTKMEDTLLEGEEMMKGLQPSSPMYQELQGNLNELQRLLDSLQPFIEKVSAKPNLLIFSEQAAPDQEPTRKNQ